MDRIFLKMKPTSLHDHLLIGMLTNQSNKCYVTILEKEHCEWILSVYISVSLVHQNPELNISKLTGAVPNKNWLYFDKTEKLLTGALKFNIYIKTNKIKRAFC